jgi:hypothetical protein
MLPDGPQVEVFGQTPPDARPENLALHIQATTAGAAVHLIRYDYDAALDAVPPLPELSFKVRLPQPYRNMTIYSPGYKPEGTLVVSGNDRHIQLRHVPFYCIVLLNNYPHEA